MHPSSPLDAREIPVTSLSPLQVTPSHSQQFALLLRHDALRPLSRDSPARNWRRVRFSCSVHAMAGEAKKSSRNNGSTTGEKLKQHIWWCFFPLVLLLLEECTQYWYYLSSISGFICTPEPLNTIHNIAHFMSWVHPRALDYGRLVHKRQESLHGKATLAPINWL
jgi:hypothetical protein